MSLYFLCIK